MPSDFVCKDCGYRSQHVDAIFDIEFAASYSHDGLVYRQRALRVIGCGLDESMEKALSSCSNCGKKGVVADIYDKVSVCGNCGNDTDDKGGYCQYNTGIYCSKCFTGFKQYCGDCMSHRNCELRIANMSTKERIKNSVGKKEEEKPVDNETARQMAQRLSEQLQSGREQRERDRRQYTNTDGSLSFTANEDVRMEPLVWTDNSEESEDE